MAGGRRPAFSTQRRDCKIAYMIILCIIVLDIDIIVDAIRKPTKIIPILPYYVMEVTSSTVQYYLLKCSSQAGEGRRPVAPSSTRLVPQPFALQGRVAVVIDDGDESVFAVCVLAVASSVFFYDNRRALVVLVDERIGFFLPNRRVLVHYQ